MKVFLVILTFCVGHILGWIGAHHTVAMECKRLGAFYVGAEDFICQKKG